MDAAYEQAVNTIVIGAQGLIRRHDAKIAQGIGGSNEHEWFYGCDNAGKDALIATYLRAGMRIPVYGHITPTLELATIDIREQRRGIGSALLSRLEDLAQEHSRVFMIENVLNVDFARHISCRLGYETLSHPFGMTFYRMPKIPA